MAYHRIYRYTSIARPFEPKSATTRAMLVLLPSAALLGAVASWLAAQPALQILQQGVLFLLIAYGSWALARELYPDDPFAAFISLAFGLLAALATDSPGILIVFTTIALVRAVNRSSGLESRTTDSVLTLLLVLLVMYATDSAFFGLVAALAFILDGSLREPSRQQWVFGLICVAATIVYVVDHDIGLKSLAAPDTLFKWLSVLFLLIFALNTALLKTVRATGDAYGKALDPARVRGGMLVGLFAALQGIIRPDSVVIIVAVIAGICTGMAVRKGFKAPVTG
ncbi:MAG: hypothetical protein HKN57_13475 [Xanthomonadales bacterium]|nr:hypothetical protein [Gammaproteobacteria bacterium]MBT8053909.1 hypothetical protein [Gammaproteobacteria bacterium]NND58250.1 hypothetical protein [Xanthomonadales bacterium]NNK52039.1 hypothetical protein [Xanthomonadales bacterium]